MNKEEPAEIYKKIREAINGGDYKEASRIQHLKYENTYKKYNELLDKRKKALPEEKIMFGISINLCKANLEKMIANAIRIQELNLSKNKNEPQ